ncbi:hypothetical protein VUJ46_12400 [Chryseobacterium sp. MYb264]|uniref:hypothetical protein n=1 Tax=Chryseobacterium sp. MYb264 TaxID=2745153 RepID=UPI002E125509|nr:hypothetical protein VUJ46_12400 [Chryseobacterium sp. MYb264]
MKKIIVVSFILLSQIAFSQVSVTRKGKLLKDGQEYRMTEYEKVFQNTEAKHYFQKYRTNSTVSMIFGGIGGGCMGFGLARALSGGDKTVTDQYGKQHKTETKGWGLVGIGAGLVAIAIPFALSSKKNFDKALNAENETSTAFYPYFKLEGSGNGMALSYNF